MERASLTLASSPSPTAVKQFVYRIAGYGGQDGKIPVGDGLAHPVKKHEDMAVDRATCSVSQDGTTGYQGTGGSGKRIQQGGRALQDAERAQSFHPREGWPAGAPFAQRGDGEHSEPGGIDDAIKRAIR